jgi:ubiquinone/menaquinone biosynthesis C-methylase UbiE
MASISAGAVLGAVRDAGRSSRRAARELRQSSLQAAYRVQQGCLRHGILGAHRLLRGLAGGQAPDAQALAALEREYARLLERDLANVAAGLYPAALLFQLPLLDYARTLPRFLADLPRTVLRQRRGAFDDLPEDVDRARFPAYFRRTFHWQTDGYLSRRSAGLYDFEVELVFLGCADVMRRQVIPPIARFARRRRRLRVLDVGCGTGRTLHQLAAALPGQAFSGVDLSPYYLERARELLARVPEVTLLAEKAEKLPFRDAWFDVVTSTYLLHELPRRARREALSEMARVLRPGGLLVLEDSAQLAEADDLAFFLETFASQMHEPFYRDYVRDDLRALVEAAGLEPAGVERAWLSKVVSARKPA